VQEPGSVSAMVMGPVLLCSFCDFQHGCRSPGITAETVKLSSSRQASAGDATVTGLFTAAATGTPMESHLAVELVAGAGISGDRYALKTGFWSDPVWPDQEITLIESEVVRALAAEPGELRRNVETQGLRLRGLVGATFHIGAAELVGVRPCDPCLHLERLTRPGIARALVSKGGLRARIVRGGRVRVGDEILTCAQSARPGDEP
jgi:hypothetical protein